MGHRRADIQGLRAIAVLLVVLFHSGLGILPGGYVGVDVFFVISGYLITGLLVAELERRDRICLVDFYARRVRRLLPAATLVLAATLAAAWLLYSPLELRQFAASAAATAAYVSNLWFAYLSTDYLADKTGSNPLLHTWSLSAEEQFYLIWPGLLWVAARWRGAVGLRGRLLAAILAVSLVSCVVDILLTAYAQPWAFFGSPARAWEFGLGGVVALWTPGPRTGGAAMRNLCGLLGIVLIGCATLVFDARTVFPGVAAFLPVLGATAIVAAGHRQAAPAATRWLGARPLTFVGDISYSLYLWHWPVFVFLPRLIPGGGVLVPLLGLALSLLLAWLTCRLVENPIRCSDLALRHLGGSLALGLLLSVSSASFAFGIRHWSQSGATAQQRYEEASQDLPAVYRNGCHLGYLQVEPPPCVFGAADADTTLVLFGDSHAAQWFPALESIVTRQGWRLVSLTKSGCPSVIFEPFNADLGRRYVECTQWRERAFERIAAWRPRFTLVANSSGYLAAPSAGRPSVDVRTWQLGLQSTLTRLRAIGGAVIRMHDTPRLPFSAPACLSRARQQGRDGVVECVFGLPEDGPEALGRLALEVPGGGAGGGVLDMTDAICPRAPCPVERGGLVLFRDDNHLTARFSRRLDAVLLRRIEHMATHDADRQAPVNWSGH